MSTAQVQDEVRAAWTNAYSPEANRRALASIANEPVPYKISHLVARFFFRGIYFPQKGALQWLKLVAHNRAAIFRIVTESFTRWNGVQGLRARRDFNGSAPYVPLPGSAPRDSGGD
jgi:hypothetical protein